MTDFERLLYVYNGNTLFGSKAKLSKDLGVAQTTVSSWIFGRAFPSADRIEQMAKLFDVSIEEIEKCFPKRKVVFKRLPDTKGSGMSNTVLINHSDEEEIIPLTKENTIRLPILADVPAGLPDWSTEDVESYLDVPRYIFPGGSFVVRCAGDSLEPNIMRGDFCVIRKTEDPIDGKAMLVRTEEGQTMKIINKLQNGSIELKSTNPNYAPFVPNKLEVIGLIIGHFHRDLGGI